LVEASARRDRAGLGLLQPRGLLHQQGDAGPQLLGVQVPARRLDVELPDRPEGRGGGRKMALWGVSPGVSGGLRPPLAFACTLFNLRMHTMANETQPAEVAPEDILETLETSDMEFRGETIYFLVVDRFHDGNPANNAGPAPDLFDPTRKDWGK